MKLIPMIVVASITFGLCYCLDKGFMATFRNQAQHKSGKSVRFSKRYAAIGIVLTALGLAGFFCGFTEGILFLIAGPIVMIFGLFLILRYMSFGIFYDDDSFILMQSGKKQKTFRFSDITSQQLYNASGNIVIELYLKDGTFFSLQSVMDGVYPFMDHAYESWCVQNGMDSDTNDFHHPENHCWFPQA